MSKNERDALLEQAVSNGWDDGEVMAAYFDACFDDCDDLIFMARTKCILPEHLCGMCGGLLVPGDGISCVCESEQDV